MRIAIERNKPQSGAKLRECACISAIIIMRSEFRNLAFAPLRAPQGVGQLELTLRTKKKMALSKLTLADQSVLSLMTKGTIIFRGHRGSARPLGKVITAQGAFIEVSSMMLHRFENAGIPMETYQNNATTGWETVIPQKNRDAVAAMIEAASYHVTM